MAENKNTTKPKSTTTKKSTTSKSSTTKKPTTKKTPTKSSTTPKKSTTSTTKKPASSTTKKPTSTTKKTPAKGSSKTVKTDAKPTKTTSKSLKTDSAKPKRTRKPATKKPKPQGRVKKAEELTTLEALEAQVEGKEIREKQPLGRVFYLVFSVVFYAIAFFYINTSVYAGEDYLQTAIFAFAALFIAFILMLFNVHMMVFYFFILPLRRLFKQARQEANKEIIYSVGKNAMQTTFNKYRSIFTLVLYFLFGALLVTSSILSSISTNDSILEIIYSALIVIGIYTVVFNSWQFLFHIIPSILEKSIDAKNGYVLALSAAVIIIYIIFMIFEITYLAEIMIFILIIGFVALLGVNLNMIVGEINIFQNLRGRKSKAVTRVVFTIFFGFHIYVIIYASVVAFSIYNWDENSFNFSDTAYEFTINDDLYTTGGPIEAVHDINGDPYDVVYDMAGNEMTQAVDNDGITINTFDENGGMIFDWYDSNGVGIFNITDSDGNMVSNYFFYEGKLAVVENRQEKAHTYGDFLYWTVISVSTIGYGDIAPASDYAIAQAWGGFLGIYGLTFFALSISFVSNIAMEGVNIVRGQGKQDD